MTAPASIDLPIGTWTQIAAAGYGTAIYSFESTDVVLVTHSDVPPTGNVGAVVPRFQPVTFSQADGSLNLWAYAYRTATAEPLGGTPATGGVVTVAGTVSVSPVPSASAAAPTKARVMSAATTNATSVKASAGNLYAIRLFNLSAATKYVKFYDKASAPTVGTDTPVFTLPLPAGGGFSEVAMPPISFSIGIAYAITGAVSDGDTTAVSANDVVGFMQYL